MKSALAALALALPLAAQALPSFEDVRAAHRPSDLTLLDRHGVPLQTLRVDTTMRRLRMVPIAGPRQRCCVIVLSRDKRFHEHSGVDWRAVAASAWGNLWNTRTRGASTLTMQLAASWTTVCARPPAGGSVAAKLGRSLHRRAARTRLEQEPDLEAYLSSVPLRRAGGRGRHRANPVRQAGEAAGRHRSSHHRGAGACVQRRAERGNAPAGC